MAMWAGAEKHTNIKITSGNLPHLRLTVIPYQLTFNLLHYEKCLDFKSFYPKILPN